MIGKNIRMKRIFSFYSGKTILLPLDHGVTVGAIKGLEQLPATVERFANTGKVNAIIGHRRMLECISMPSVKPVSGILHISASTCLSTSNKKVLVATVEDAIALGADAISVHINLGELLESELIQQLGSIVSSAREYGIPVLAMMYVRRGEETLYTEKEVMISARMADDIGVDMVKVPYTGSVETFARVVEACTIPVLIAGGERIDNAQEVLNMVYGALQAGAKGISIGRNIFGAEYALELLDALELLVHKNASLRSATMLYETSVHHATQR